MIRNNTNPWLELFGGIFIISTSGVLGRYISLSPEVIIAIRSIIGVLTLYIFIKLAGGSIKIDYKRYKRFLLLSAFFLSIHWITYFYSLKLSNVAIAMLSLNTYPVITSVLEPLWLKTKFHPYQLILGITALFGIYFLLPVEFRHNGKLLLGIGAGLLSSLLWAIRNIYSRKYIQRIDGTVLMFYQLLGGSVILLPFVFTTSISSITEEFGLLLLLGIFTTATGHTLFLKSLKHFTVSTASIISALNPVFGITLAVLLLGEIPSPRVYLGGAFILSSVLVESIYGTRLKNRRIS